MGGTLAAMYAALHPDGPIRNLVLLTAPCDFSNPGVMERWLAPENFDVDHVVVYGDREHAEDRGQRAAVVDEVDDQRALVALRRRPHAAEHVDLRAAEAVDSLPAVADGD